MPSSSVSDREQQISQDATENERNTEQEFQNRIHHGLLLKGINSKINLKSVSGHTLITLRVAFGAFRPDSVDRASEPLFLVTVRKTSARV
jgi:hypothetical protein